MNTVYIKFRDRPFAEVETEKRVQDVGRMFDDNRVSVTSDVDGRVRGGAPRDIMNKAEQLRGE